MVTKTPKAPIQSQSSQPKPVETSKVEAPKVEAPKAPETVDLKVVAAQAGVEPRRARALLRQLGIRPPSEKRSRWAFLPKDVPGIVAKIKAAKQKAEEVRARTEKEEEGEEE